MPYNEAGNWQAARCLKAHWHHDGPQGSWHRYTNTRQKTDRQQSEHQMTTIKTPGAAYIRKGVEGLYQ